MSKLLLAVAFAAMVASAGEAKAQSYPSRSITIIVPYAAGALRARRVTATHSALATWARMS